MLKFGIIGTSWITEAYVDGALDSGLWELTAIYSRTRERGAAFGEKYKVDKVFTDLDEMAASSDIDAVYIASPNYLHTSHAMKFIAAGKHVICEKPLASHAREVLELQKAAEKNNVIYLEAIMFMHLPARKLLDEAVQKIGPVSMAKFDFCQRSSKLDQYLEGEIPNIFNPEMEAGALMDLGIYCLYPALYLFGEPEGCDISVTMLDTGVDGSGAVTMKYSDKLVTIPYSKVGQAGADSDIQGTLGTISIASISKLGYMKITYADGRTEDICGEEPKFKLMGYEAKDFYRFIANREETAEEYARCAELSLQVTKLLEELRKKAGIFFPSDK